MSVQPLQDLRSGARGGRRGWEEMGIPFRPVSSLSRVSIGLLRWPSPLASTDAPPQTPSLPLCRTDGQALCRTRSTWSPAVWGSVQLTPRPVGKRQSGQLGPALTLHSQPPTRGLDAFGQGKPWTEAGAAGAVVFRTRQGSPRALAGGRDLPGEREQDGRMESGVFLPTCRGPLEGARGTCWNRFAHRAIEESPQASCWLSPAHPSWAILLPT